MACRAGLVSRNFMWPGRAGGIIRRGVKEMPAGLAYEWQADFRHMQPRGHGGRSRPPEFWPADLG